MTTSPAGERVSENSRLESIKERVALLRRQTEEIVAHSAEVTEHTRELRERRLAACNHAVQVKQMQEALQHVEHELAGLRTAMHTRGVIEQAKGMLMLHRQCDAEEAFQMLVSLSQTSHRKLVDVATTLVTTWSAGDGPA